jgi:hypothetical protein
MRFTWRDAIATLLVAAVVVPYIGYLINGRMPFLQDPRGMAATALVLGLAAALVLGRDAFAGSWGRVAAVLGLLTGVVGIGTLVWAEEGALSEVLLAFFVGGIVLTWALRGVAAG